MFIVWFTTIFVRSLVCSSNQYASFFTMQILSVSNAIFSSGQIKRQRTIIFGMRRWRNRWTTCHLHPFVALQKIVPFTFLQEKKVIFSSYCFLATFLKMNEGNSQMPKTVVMRKKDFSRNPRWWWSFLHALLKHFQNDKRAQIELKKKGDRAELIAKEQISDYMKKIIVLRWFLYKNP